MFLVIIIMAMGVVLYYKDYSHKKEVTKLYNEIATQAETIEVQDGVYKKQSLVIANNSTLLSRLAGKNEESFEALKRLDDEISKKDEMILSLTKAKAVWKKDYEALVKATEEKVETAETQSTRTKISFEKNFGYISASGWTLTNPAEAYIRVAQNKPLTLVLALTQDKKSRWSTTVASSEDNVGVDIDISSVNPYMFDMKWYEKVSVDIGIQYAGGMFPYVGTSYALNNGIYFGAGVWGTQNAIGAYGSVGYSWTPFRR